MIVFIMLLQSGSNKESLEIKIGFRHVERTDSGHIGQSVLKTELLDRRKKRNATEEI